MEKSLKINDCICYKYMDKDGYIYSESFGIITMISDKDIEIKNAKGELERLEFYRGEDRKTETLRFSEIEFLEMIKREEDIAYKEFREIQTWKETFRNDISFTGRLKRFLSFARQ